MALPENYWPRRGDRIVIAGTVNYDVIPDGGKYVFLDIGADGNSHEIGIPINIAKVYGNLARRTWRVGDRVFNELEQVWGTVAHVDDEWVCVKATKVGDSDYQLGLYVWTANELEPWPEEPATGGAGGTGNTSPASPTTGGPAAAADQPPPPTGW